MSCCSALFRICSNYYSRLFTRHDEPFGDQPNVIERSIECLDETGFEQEIDTEEMQDALMRSGACIVCSAVGKCDHRAFMDGPPVYPNLDRGSSLASSYSTLTLSSLTDEPSLPSDDEYDHDRAAPGNSLLREIDEVHCKLLSLLHESAGHLGCFKENTKVKESKESAWAQLVSNLEDLLASDSEKPELKMIEDEAIETLITANIIKSCVETMDYWTNYNRTNYCSFLGSSLAGRRGKLPKKRFLMPNTGRGLLHGLSPLPFGMISQSQLLNY